MKYENILVPVDGSTRSENTVDLAIFSANDFGSELTFVYVLDVSQANRFGDVSGTTTLAKMDVEGTIALDVATSKAKKAGIKFKTQSLNGIPGEVICDLSKDYDMIIIGSTGKTGMGKGRIGGTAAYIIENSDCPVLCVKSVSTKLEKILLPVVDTHLPAIDDAIETAKRANALVTIYSVGKIGNDLAKKIEDVADRFKQVGLDVETVNEDGDPAERIIAKSDDYDLIIMGVGKRSGLKKILRGNTVERVVANASCPVTTIRDE